MPIDAIDDAVMTKLQSDATLAAVAPGLVHRDFAPEGAVAAGIYVVVILQIELPTSMFGGVSYVLARYRIKATARDEAKTQAQAALDRVDELLHLQPLTVAGHIHMRTARVARESQTDVDGPVTWRTQIADYEVWAAPV